MNIPFSHPYWNLPPGCSPRDCEGPHPVDEEVNRCRICDKRIEIGDRLCDDCQRQEWEEEDREQEKRENAIEAAEMRMALSNPKYDR